VHVLRKLIINDNELHSFIPLIHQEFGFIKNLLVKYHSSQMAIDSLKVRELLEFLDEFLKRRPLETYDQQGLYVMVVYLQNEVDHLRGLLRSVNQKGTEALTIMLSEEESPSTELDLLKIQFEAFKKKNEKLEQDLDFFEKIVIWKVKYCKMVFLKQISVFKKDC
jgi:hypothetical protein